VLGPADATTRAKSGEPGEPIQPRSGKASVESAPVTVTVTPAARVALKDGSDPVTQLTALSSSVGADGVSISALNLTTGASFNFGATAGMTMGSIAKLDTLEVLLLQHEDTHTMLSDDEVALATAMIEQSDNDAADSLWSEVGSDPAVSAANPRLGVPGLVVGTDGYWGLGTTDASDQVTLLHNLVATGGPLDAPSQAFALGLMRGVESDQRWGVGAISDAGTTFANKNGWLAVDDDSDLWLINSDGVVTVHGQSVLISILTQHNASEDAGISLVQALAQAVVPAIVK
jgi:hypothetical protein